MTYLSQFNFIFKKYLGAVRSLFSRYGISPKWHVFQPLMYGLAIYMLPPAPTALAANVIGALFYVLPICVLYRFVWNNVLQAAGAAFRPGASVSILAQLFMDMHFALMLFFSVSLPLRGGFGLDTTLWLSDSGNIFVFFTLALVWFLFHFSTTPIESRETLDRLDALEREIRDSNEARAASFKI